MIWIPIAVLFVGSIVSYALGVRQQKSWGKPALVICTIVLVAAVICKALPDTGGGGPDLYASGTEGAAEMMGKELADSIESGCRVFFIGGALVESDGQARAVTSPWLEAFSKGAGGVSCDLAGYAGGAAVSLSANAISQAVKRSEGKVDILLSFAGLPDDLTSGALFTSFSRPKVGAYFPPGREVPLKRVRRWLQKNYVHVVVADDGTQLQAYTKQNLPSSSPKAEGGSDENK